jgi:hypothetical protein
MNCIGFTFFVNLVKLIVMSVTELKMKLLQEIDTLKKSKLEQIYGLVLNCINKDNDTEEWNALTTTQQKGLLDAIKEMNSSKGMDHKKVMEKHKNKN